MIDTLTVTETHLAQTVPTFADVELTLEQTSFAGRGPARVAALREALGARGLDEGDLAVLDVTSTPWTWLPVAAGVFATPASLFLGGRAAAGVAFALFAALAVLVAAVRATALTVQLRVRCAGAERVSAALDAALRDRHVSVRAVRWQHEPDAGDREEWTHACVTRARARADSIAAALGVRLVGVHSFRADDLAPDAAAPPALRAEVAVKRKLAFASTAGEDLGPSLRPAERMGVAVTVVFRVRPLERGP